MECAGIDALLSNLTKFQFALLSAQLVIHLAAGAGYCKRGISEHMRKMRKQGGFKILLE